jgi:hypothetical protein
MGANGITQATPTCFLITFVIVFGEIFLKYFWNILEKSSKNPLIFFNSYYFIKVHVKNLAKNVI